MSAGVTLDFSRAQSLQPTGSLSAPVLDFSKAEMLPGATAEAMANEGVTDYQPGQGLPYGHYGDAMRSSDLTPSQAANGVLAIGATAGSVVGGGLGLDKIVKIAKALGYTSFGLKEAHDLYKTVFGGDQK